MEPTMIVNLVIGGGSIIVAAVVAAFVGKRRGLDQVEERTDSEIKKTMDAQSVRLTLQDREIAELKLQVASLQSQIATLQTELDIERRISLRFRGANEVSK